MRIPILAAILLALCVALTGCKHSLHTQEVIEFVDKADNAARKRFAPGICQLRGENFTLSVNFQGYQERLPPSKLEMNRKLFCMEAGKFSRIRQYKLERKSIKVNLADDRKSATVTSEYVETLPYYEPDMVPRYPEDFRQWQIVETRDESIVGFEDGDLVFLSTRGDAVQKLVEKNEINLPFLLD